MRPALRPRPADPIRPAPAAATEPAPVAPGALVALGLAGLCAFLNVYVTQPLLPALAAGLGVSRAAAALTVSAPTIAVALASPLVASVAGRLGYRNTIVGALAFLVVPTLLAATARDIRALVAWRFVQGLAVPGVYAVGITYATERWSGRGVARALSMLVAGSVVGGFVGRVLAGVAAERWGWPSAFVVLGALTAALAVAVASTLPPEPRRARGRASPLDAVRALRDRTSRPRLLATLAVGFNVLFTLVATFTYVTFRLADPPFRLEAGAMGSVFVVYLFGAVVTPWGGRWIGRVGSRRALAVMAALGVAGGALTLVPWLPAVCAGLALCCTSAFVSQAASTSYLQHAVTRQAHAAAAGLYISCYYLGGSAGGVVPALTWHAGGWPACVALVAAVQVASAAVALRFWRGVAPHGGGSPAADHGSGVLRS